jgi:hypothetical protein
MDAPQGQPDPRHADADVASNNPLPITLLTGFGYGHRYAASPKPAVCPLQEPAQA